MTFEIRHLNFGQPTLWCLNCNQRVRVIYRNEWGYVEQWKRTHAQGCSGA